MVDLQTLIDFFQNYGYVAVFSILLACGFGLPIPEDITLVAGGVISGLGDTNVHVMVFVALLGVLLGDSVMFSLGRFLGTKILQYKMVQKVVTEERYKKIQDSFEKYGVWFLFFARFMPGLRSPIFVVTGVTKRVPFWKFFSIDAFAAFISVPIWVYLGYFGANNIDKLLGTVKKSQSNVLISIVVLLGIVTVFHLIKVLLRRRGIANKYGLNLEKIMKKAALVEPSKHKSATSDKVK